jgi:pimeloyl-ACP methyl ester carboxylesterase
MEQQIIINGQLISYLEYGAENTGSTVIFLHGWRSQKEVWKNIVASSKYQVARSYVLDLPGFGKSPTPASVWTIGDYAEVVKGFIEKLELKNIILVGHSFGGRIAIKLAAQNSNWLSKMVLVDSAGIRDGQSTKKALSYIVKIVKPIFKPKFMQGFRKEIYKKIGARDYVETPELQKTFVNVVNEDLRDYLPKIKVPTLLIWGEKDLDTPVAHAYFMKEKIVDSKLFVIKNAGHFCFLEKLEKFAVELNKFIVE